MVALLCLEGSVRVLSLRLQPVEPWPSTDYTRHERRLAAEGNQVDTLVVGSSSVGVAVRPTDLPEGGAGYNYWLAGPSMRSVADLTSEVLLGRVSPSTVLIGVTMREFNDGPSQRAHHTALVESYPFKDETGRSTLIDDADEVLKSVSALARHRDVLRDPVRLVDQLQTGPLTPENMAADGHLADRGNDQMVDEPAEHLEQERDAMFDYALADGDVDALDRLLSTLTDRRISAVVVNLPVSAKFIGLANGGQDAQQRFTNRIRLITETHGAVWVDSMSDLWEDEWFADVNHLNDRGVARLRPTLAAALVEARAR